MNSSTLPESLRSIDTRSEHNLNRDVMIKYQKISNTYANTKNIGSNLIYDMEDIELETNETHVFDMIDQAKNKINFVQQKNKELEKIHQEYEEMKQNCEQIIDQVTNISKIYYELSVKNEIAKTRRKLEVKREIFDLSFIHELKEEIHSLILDIDQNIIDNSTKMRNYKDLVKKCLSDEDKKEETLNINMCTICYTNKINTCLNPCGHTFCDICIEKMFQRH